MAKKHIIKCSTCHRELKVPDDINHIISEIKCPSCGEKINMYPENQGDIHPFRHALKRKIRVLLIICLLALGAFICLYILNNFIFSTSFKKEKERLSRDVATYIEKKLPTSDAIYSAES